MSLQLSLLLGSIECTSKATSPVPGGSHSNQVPPFHSTKKLVNIFPNIGPRHIMVHSSTKAIDITFTHDVLLE